MTTMNVVAILVASAIAFVIGGVWYAPPVFGKAWMALSGISYDELHKRPMGLVFGGSFLLAVVMTVNLSMFLGPDPSLAFATAAGAAAGVGWTAAGFGITYLFERRPFKLWLINGGYHAVTLTAIGFVLGLFSMWGHAKTTTSAEVRLTSYTTPSGERVLRHEVDLDALGRNLVQKRADLWAVALPDLVDEVLGGDADIHRVALLGDEASRGEPVLILRPVNDLLQAGENLLPDVHRREKGPLSV